VDLNGVGSRLVSHPFLKFFFCIFVSILFGTFPVFIFKLGLDPVYSFKLQFEISSVRVLFSGFY
jgi:hypothetical protein